MSFRPFPTIGALGAVLAIAGTASRRSPAIVSPNPNTTPVGVFRKGVLTVELEARTSLYRIGGPARPPMTTEAFAELGKDPIMPGPLVRAAVGTEIRLSVRNSLSLPLTLFVPEIVRGGPDRIAAVDSVVIAPGETGMLTTRATTPGNYVYRATVPTHSAQARRSAGLLAGALIVDSARATAHDRVFVIMETWDSLHLACGDTAVHPLAGCDVGRSVFTINGRSWPNTERVTATVGDSVRWRVINASNDIHPMHLHGFYFRVDEYAGPFADIRGRPMPGQMVVTQPLPPWSGMSMSWSPDRPGNWLFHCHFALHTMPDSVSAEPDDPHMRAMSGLVVGVSVAPRPGVRVAGEPTATRHLRLIAVEDSTEDEGRHGAMYSPPMRFLLDDGSRRVDAGPDFSPELDLVRGEPVAITIINHLDEPTSVHWHGVEVEDSYVDGVPNFSGAGKHLAPAIAPGDSFVARFTPPRSGTFMYHAHVDDMREQSAGLVGALIVREPRATVSPDEHVFLLKSSRMDKAGSTPVEINGRLHPDTIVLRAGHAARFRLINLVAHHNAAAATFELGVPPGRSANSAKLELVRWQPVAKDGADLPSGARAAVPAREVVTIGETFDFEYTPERPGPLVLQISATNATGPGPRLVAVPIRVK